MDSCVPEEIIPVPRQLAFVVALGSVILLVAPACRNKKARLNLETTVTARGSSSLPVELTNGIRK